MISSSANVFGADEGCSSGDVIRIHIINGVNRVSEAIFN